MWKHLRIPSFLPELISLEVAITNRGLMSERQSSGKVLAAVRLGYVGQVLKETDIMWWPPKIYPMTSNYASVQTLGLAFTSAYLPPLGWICCGKWLPN